MLNRLQAETIANIIHNYRPDYPRNAIAHTITNPEIVTGYTDLQIITAAFNTANDPTAKTIKGCLPRNLAALVWEPSDAVTSWTGEIRPVPHGDNGNHSQKVEECPAHTGKPKSNCPGCLADVKAGDREPSQMNVVL